MNEAPGFVAHVDVPLKSELVPPCPHAGFVEKTMVESRSSNIGILMKYGCRND